MILSVLLSSVLASNIDSIRDTSPARDYRYEIILSTPVGSQFEGMGARVIGECNGVPIKLKSWEENSYISKHEKKTGHVRSRTFNVGYDFEVILNNCNEVSSNEEVSFLLHTQHLGSMKKKVRKVQPSSQEKELYGSKAPDYGYADYQKPILERLEFEGKTRMSVEGRPQVIGNADGGDFKLTIIRR